MNRLLKFILLLSLFIPLPSQAIPDFEILDAFKVTNYLELTIIAVALVTVVFSLKRFRRKMIQAMKTCSQWLLNFNKSKQAQTIDWILSGFDQQRKAIYLPISKQQLQQSGCNLTIGRSPKLCELIINDGSLCRRHARLIYMEEHLYLEDLNSLNGTWVNCGKVEPFKPVPLEQGKLVLGEIELSLMGNGKL